MHTFYRMLIHHAQRNGGKLILLVSLTGLLISKPGFATPPGAPVFLTPARVVGGVSLTWSPAAAGSNPISGYEIWRSSSGTPLSFLAAVSAPATSFFDSLSGSFAFYYAVRAVDDVATPGPFGPQAHVLSTILTPPPLDLCPEPQLWTQTYASYQDDQPQAIALDSYDNVFVGGFTGINWLLQKFDARGNLLWQQTPNSGVFLDGIHDIATDAAGDVVAVGFSYNTYIDGMIRKYDPDGVLLWTRTFSDPGLSDDRAQGVAIDSAGSIIVTGRRSFSGILTIKYDANGNFLWEQDYYEPGAAGSVGYGVAVDSLDDILVVGEESSTSFVRGRIFKYDSAGTLLWSRSLPANGPAYNQAVRVAVDAAGGATVVGKDPDGPGARVLKFDSAGAVLWSATFGGWGGAMDGTPAGVVVQPDGSGIVCGYQDRNDVGQSANWRVQRFDASGNWGCCWTYNNPSDNADIASAVAIDSTGGVIVAGSETRWDLGQDFNVRVTRWGGTLPPIPPSSPPTLDAAVLVGSIRLVWSAANPGTLAVSGYEIWRATCGTCGTNLIGSVPDGTYIFSDGDVTAGTSYSFKVRAIDASGLAGAFSVIATAVSVSSYSDPGVPASLTATVYPGPYLWLEWDEATTGTNPISGYEIWRSTCASCGSGFYDVVDGYSLSYADFGATAAGLYSYQVRAVDLAGVAGGFSPVASASYTPPILPGSVIVEAGPPGGPLTVLTPGTDIPVGSWVRVSFDLVNATGQLGNMCADPNPDVIPGWGMVTCGGYANPSVDPYDCASQNDGTSGIWPGQYWVWPTLGSSCTTACPAPLHPTRPDAPLSVVAADSVTVFSYNGGTYAGSATAYETARVSWTFKAENAGVAIDFTVYAEDDDDDPLCGLHTPVGSFYDCGYCGLIGDGTMGSILATYWGTPLTITGTGSFVPPSAPPSASATGDAAVIRLSWTAATPGDYPVSKYEIYRSSCPACAFVLWESVPFTYLAITDGEVEPGTTYQYRVAAIDGHGYLSAFGPTVSAMPTPCTGPSWFSRAPMSTPRFEPGYATLGGMIYVAGGTTDTAAGKTLERYDPATGAWLTLAPMSTTRWALGMAAVGGTLYAVGGLYSQSLVEAYDPATNSWATKAPLPRPVYRAAVVGVNGKLYVIGGMWPMTTVVQEYNPATNTWLFKTPMPGSGGATVAAGVVNGIIYVAGGYDGGLEITRRVLAYDPNADTWSERALMPSDRADLIGATSGGTLFAIGGASVMSLAGPRVEAYEPASDTWSELCPMPVGRRNGAAACVNGVLYVIGGQVVGGITSAMIATTPSAPPAAPTFLTAQGGAGWIKLQWSPALPGGAPISRYEIWRGTCSGCSASLVAWLWSTSTVFVDQFMAPGIAYVYEVRAQDIVGNSGSFSPAAVATASAAPPVISKFQAPPNPVPGGPVTYQIVYPNLGGYTKIILIDTVATLIGGVVTDQPAEFGSPLQTAGPLGTRYTWTSTLTGDPTAVYTFTITGTVGQPPFSLTVTNTAQLRRNFPLTTIYTSPPVAFSVAGSSTLVSAPGSLTALGQPAGIDLAWSPAQAGAFSVSGYEIWRGTCSTCALDLTATLTGTAFTDGAVTLSRVYYYRVRAVDPAGTPGPFSSIASALAGGAAFQLATTVQFAINPLQPIEGDVVLFVIVVKNTGGTTITNLTVTDTLPPEFMFSPASQPAGFGPPLISQVPGGTLFTWSAGSLTFAPGTIMDFVLTATACADCALYRAMNTAYIEAGDGTTITNQTGAYLVTIQGAQLFGLKMQATPLVQVPGGPVTYTIEMRSKSLLDVEKPSVVDTLPPEVSFVASDAPASMGPMIMRPTVSGTCLSWSVSLIGLPLPSGVTFTFTITAVLNSAALGTTVANTAMAGGRKVTGIFPSSTQWATSTFIVGAATPPASPAMLSTIGRAGDIFVSWSPAVPGSYGISCYEVWRSTCGFCSFTLTATLTGTAYADGAVIPTDTYYYQVRAVDQAGNRGPFSAIERAAAGWPSYVLAVEVKDTFGAHVRSFPPVPATWIATAINFSYTAAGSCVTWTSSATAPFTPDGDCANDILKIVLPDPVVNGQPFDGIWWDGMDDASKAVPPDLYNIHVTSTNTVTGASYTTIRTVTLATAPPTAPGAVTAMSGPMQIDVEWTPAAPGGAPIAQYIVWRSSCAACVGFGFSVGPSASTFQDGQLPGTVGYYRVQAQDSFGVKGPLSPQVVATSGAAAGTLLKSQSPAAPIPGGPLSYLLTVVNPNGVGMYLHMWDTLPAGFAFAALEGFPAPSGTTLIPSSDGVHSVLDWWVGNAKVIMNAGIYTLTLTGQAPAVSGTFCNEAHAEMWVGAIPPTMVLELDSNQVCFTLTYSGGALATLAGSLSVAPGTVGSGDTLTVTLHVTNTGTGAAVNLMPGIAVTSGGALVSPATGPLPAGPAPLAAGASQDFVWTYTAVAAGTVSWTAQVTGSDAAGGQPVQAAATGSATIVAGPGPGTVIVVGGAAGTVDPTAGETATMTAYPSGPGTVTLDIYDMGGFLVRTMTAATGGLPVVFSWDIKDAGGTTVPPGVYPIHVSGPGLNKSDTIGVLY